MKDKIIDEYNKIEFDAKRKEEILDVILEEYDEIKENRTMKKTLTTVASVALCALIGVPTAVYAATHFLSAKETASYLGSEELAKLYSDCDVIATAEDGDYRFAYLGNVNAKLKETFLNEGEDASTYVALAIEKIDGTPMQENEIFVASPLIQGLDPFIYNVFSMGGGATWNTKDGVLYMIMNVNDIEIFADKKIYLAITTGPDYKTGYMFDETTGIISKNESFAGINELFEMNFDASKANTAAQEQYLANFGSSENEDMSEFADEEWLCCFDNIDYEKIDNATYEAVINAGTIVENYEFKPENGVYYVDYDSDEYGGVSGEVLVEYYEIDMITLSSYSVGDDSVCATFEKRDGNDVLHIMQVLYDAEQQKKVSDLLK